MNVFQAKINNLLQNENELAIAVENECTTMIIENHKHECGASTATDNNDDGTETGIGTQTDITMDELSMLLEKIQIADSLNDNLRAKLAYNGLTQESFVGNNRKVKYFTGLDNYETLILLHDTAAPYLSNTSLTVLTTFQQLILTLMKLRLNLPFQYLSYRFSHLYCIFISIIHLLKFVTILILYY